jgi:DNA-binding SARP family transcriptional activator
MVIDVRAPVQFRVLGPLEASRDGQPVRLGGERQRALLAMLLVRANELVSTEQLVEQLFGGEWSDGAANAVHVAVSRLRRVLESSGGALVVTRPGGYRLELEPDQLDAALFERLLENGRDRLAAGDPASAAARLREALALWRGPPLADVAQLNLVRPEVRRLEELRLLAVMERIDADLALGHGADLIPEIASLVDSEPLQERLRGQLMLALYRSGRQAEALAVYREASAVLREDLGLAPSRALQKLERMVLRQDDALDVPLVAPARADAETPVVCPFKGLAFFDSSDAAYSAVETGSSRTSWRGWPSGHSWVSSGRRGLANPRCCAQDSCRR